jgi:hypothetical protein
MAEKFFSLAQPVKLAPILMDPHVFAQVEDGPSPTRAKIYFIKPKKVATAAPVRKCANRKNIDWH